LDVGRRTRLADRLLLEPVGERVDRRDQHQLELLEAEAPPHLARRGVVGQHVEADPCRAAVAGVLHAGADECRGDALPARSRADVDYPDVRAALLRSLDPRYPDGTLVILGEEHPAAADVLERVAPFLFPRLALLDERRWHVRLELAPELLEYRLVRLRRATDRHPARPGRAAASR
jgi:hypothetical protein